jgi:hypothetical protein
MAELGGAIGWGVLLGDPWLKEGSFSGSGLRRRFGISRRRNLKISGKGRGPSPVVCLKTCDKGDFLNPPASSSKDEAFFSNRSFDLSESAGVAEEEHSYRRGSPDGPPDPGIARGGPRPTPHPSGKKSDRTPLPHGGGGRPATPPFRPDPIRP